MNTLSKNIAHHTDDITSVLVNLNLYNQFSFDKILNKLVNNSYVKEMAFLNQIAANNNIKISFFIGLFEAYDLYDDPQFRSSSDLDLLVSRKDALNFINICLNNGYYFEFGYENLKEQIENKFCKNT